MSDQTSEPKESSPVSSDQRAAKIIVKGNVQGIGFRYWAGEEARSMRIKGYVENRADGSVEILAEGTKFEVDEFIKACHQGPRGAKVEDVDVSSSKPTGEYQEFEIRY